MNRDLSSGGSAEADSFLVAAAAFRDTNTTLTQAISAETNATADLTTDLYAENEDNFLREACVPISSA
jgi:hypothetical protein